MSSDKITTKEVLAALGDQGIEKALGNLDGSMFEDTTLGDAWEAAYTALDNLDYVLSKLEGYEQ